MAGALRYCLVLHFTWLVNSAAHLYGDHPYDPTIWPAENPLVSVAAIGEGWHNWHHRYPYDYAASVRACVPACLHCARVLSGGTVSIHWSDRRAQSLSHSNPRPPTPHPFDPQEFGVSQQFNPTKAWIDFFAMIGMVSNRKRATGAWAKLKQTKAADLASGKEWKGRGAVQGTAQPPGHEVNLDSKKYS